MWVSTLSSVLRMNEIRHTMYIRVYQLSDLQQYSHVSYWPPLLLAYFFLRTLHSPHERVLDADGVRLKARIEGPWGHRDIGWSLLLFGSGCLGSLSPSFPNLNVPSVRLCMYITGMCSPTMLQ